MLELTIGYLLIACTSALAAFIAARAWDYLPARLFVFVCVALLLVRLFADLRDRAVDPEPASVLATLSIAFIALLDLPLLMLFAALFAPSWYTGRRPMVWIALPYLCAALLITIDGLAGLHLIFAEVTQTPNGFRLQPMQPGGSILLVLFVLSWVPHLVLLSLAFARESAARISIALLLVALVIAQLGGSLGTGGLVQALPIMFALAYTVLRTRLFLPTKIGIETAVQAIDDGVLVLDGRGAVVFANPAAQATGLHEGAALTTVLSAAANGHVALEGRSLALRQKPLHDQAGRPIGAVLICRDVTELERREQMLEAERLQLAETVSHLAATQAERADLVATMRQLALPVIPVLPGVLIMPLIGDFDGARIEAFLPTLLQSIERERARVVLLDITGLPLLDTAGAAGLLNGVQAAALLGARCVLVGVRPEIAQTLVGLGVTFAELTTAATLQQALQHEVRRAK